MCLIATLFQCRKDAPLIVASNRDEALDRPTQGITLLQAGPPTLVGGKDLLAGGTWMATSADGVVIALTNRFGGPPRHPALKSRGLLPLLAGIGRSAQEVLEVLRRDVFPRDYNPCWLLVGDRADLFHVDLSEPTDAVKVQSLSPGIHVLENVSLEAPSSKAATIRREIARLPATSLDELTTGLMRVMGSHKIPEPVDGESLALGDRRRPDETRAACVHAGPYGTRSSTIVSLGPTPSVTPTLYYSDGPPCTNAYTNRSDLFA